jgi:uncharacterized protein YfdQ (DUF2303 family)
MSKSEKNFIESAIEAGTDRAMADDRIAEVNGIPVAVIGKHDRAEVLTNVLELLDKRANAPRRRTGTAYHERLDSFIAHTNRFKSEHTAVWSSLEDMRLTTVFDYHPGGPEHDKAAWCQHMAVYVCPHSKQWRQWARKDGRPMSQLDFADFIDEHFSALADADGFLLPAAVLDMARDLQVYTKGQFSRRVDQATGKYALVCHEEHQSKSISIPKAFMLELPVFEGGRACHVEARVCFNMHDGVPRFGFMLHRRTELEMAAFDDICKAVAEQTGLPVYTGRHEGAPSSSDDGPVADRYQMSMETRVPARYSTEETFTSLCERER